MKTKRAETRELYIVIDKENRYYIRKYLSKVEELTGILKATLSKHFNRHKKEYVSEGFIVHKCSNVDLKGHYKNNFR